jgi:uncharacterized protein
VDFEFDPDKSDANQRKHGLSFTEAQALWEDPMLIEVPARTVDESRWLVIGQLADKHWSAVVTYREQRGQDHFSPPGSQGRGSDL